MGCCPSREEAPDVRSNDVNARRRLSSRHPDGRSNRPLAPDVVERNREGLVTRGQRQELRLDERFNRPLRRHVWASKKPMTRELLRRQREEFFDTRVTGRAEVWNALRMAIESVAEGELETAQQILNASGVSVPTGDLANGAYDEFGNHYALPEYCISDPTNLLLTPHSHEALEKTAHASVDGDETEEEVESRREEKGKMSVQTGGECALKARLSDAESQDVVVYFSRDEKVKVISRRIMEEAGLSAGEYKIRIAYLGRMLRENESLHSQGWNEKEGHIVNALVFKKT